MRSSLTSAESKADFHSARAAPVSRAPPHAPKRSCMPPTHDGLHHAEPAAVRRSAVNIPFCVAATGEPWGGSGGTCRVGGKAVRALRECVARTGCNRSRGPTKRKRGGSRAAYPPYFPTPISTARVHAGDRENPQSPTESSIGSGGRRFAASEARNASRLPRPLGPGPVL